MNTRLKAKDLYKDTFHNIRPSKQSVMQMIYITEEDKMRTKRTRPRRVVVMTAICCLLLASACFAVSKIVSYESHSQATPQCTDYNDLPELLDEIDYEPIIPSDFDNGYTFKDATLGTEEGKDADGNTVDSGKILDVTYSHPKTDHVTLSTDPVMQQTDVSTYDKTRDVDGVTIGASTFIIKFVPSNYEKTADDIQREKNGTIQISYGTDTIEEEVYNSAVFSKDRITYTLLTQGKKQPSQNELMDMAEEMLR